MSVCVPPIVCVRAWMCNAGLTCETAADKTSGPRTNFVLEDKGFFTVLDSDQLPAFSILNGKNPGVFSEGVTSNDIALVLDSKNLANPVEAFELFVEVSQSLQETFQCNILDEDRNFMTKQMIEHMKHEFHERQRQLLASAS